MTRINSAIQPASLCDQHLLAEYRELPRISTLAWKYYQRDARTGLPREFALGEGHVKFFYDKGEFLKNRFDSIVFELNKRGFNCNFNVYRAHPPNMNQNHSPTEREKNLLLERIAARVPKKPRWGKKVVGLVGNT